MIYRLERVSHTQGRKHILINNNNYSQRKKEIGKLQKRILTNWMTLHTEDKENTNFKDGFKIETL